MAAVVTMEMLDCCPSASQAPDGLGCILDARRSGPPPEKPMLSRPWPQWGLEAPAATLRNPRDCRACQEMICVVFEGPPDSKSDSMERFDRSRAAPIAEGQIDSKGRGMAPGVDVGSLTY